MIKKNERQYPYSFKSLRIFNPQAYQKFEQLCKENFSNPQQTLNKYIVKCANTGTLEQ